MMRVLLNVTGRDMSSGMSRLIFHNGSTAVNVKKACPLPVEHDF